MGSYVSYETPPSLPPSTPPDPIFFSKPWREIKWGDNKADLEFVKTYKPVNEDQTIRILLHGQEGSGKSSFINSVQSVLRGHIYLQALADRNSNKSFTTEYLPYKVQKEDGSFYPFVFCDIMGLSTEGGVLEEDVNLVFKGHVKEGCKFNPASRLTEGQEFYVNLPTPNDKIHVLVCVTDASRLDVMSEEVVKKIRRIRLEASSLKIAQISILTKIDELDPEINEDIRKVYQHRKMKEMMEKFSVRTGIPMNCIFPVKNYHEEIDLNDDINSLILSALRRIINSGDDHLNYLNNQL